MHDVNIHQISVDYVAEADRLLLRVRTRDDALFALWLTRRMMRRLWPGLTHGVGQLSPYSTVAPDATVLPEAREMLLQVQRERTLQAADFTTPFESRVRELPLGPEPLLPVTIELKPMQRNHLQVLARDIGGRTVQMQLTEQLAAALLTLVERALQRSDWGIVPEPEQPAVAAAALRSLN